ncbi:MULTISPECIES: hypothetical protein [Thermus]|jgi:hypothetical protein|uniref:Uncharacterized protein n=4 Tax=Thermus thermophilus TaxID=274 RepID=Q5SJ20_THET8|nr:MULTISPECIES: hypothetical protein [Thermus]AAS81178.1 hypothetical protein TT_C0832 [Thermus thermophilus HB27]AFH38764.1 hypothetical protein TtJL18_0862 [Thermus thermophilus JL-18]QMV30888.1 hypothetical protein HB27c_C0859 [Thermus thermophilus]QZY57802.1 hypothetical protein K7H19_06045 [Thermus thermophilus]WMV96213.1 hypothetical protein RB649_04260 [Thermus thermophilus HB27]
MGIAGSLEDLARALRGTPPEARNLSRLQEIAKLLERFPPGRERDGLLAVAYLRLYQVVKRPEYLFRGYSYARTARVEEVRALAERLWEER